MVLVALLAVRPGLARAAFAQLTDSLATQVDLVDVQAKTIVVAVLNDY